MRPLALQDLPRSWSAQSFVRFIHFRQQLNVPGRVAVRKAVAPVAAFPYRAFPDVPRDEPRRLRSAQSRHLLQVLPQHPFDYLAPLPILLLAKCPADPSIDFCPIRSLKPYCIRCFPKYPDLLQAQPFFVLHADVQSSACEAHSPSGSFCIRHIPRFGLILYWTRLLVGSGLTEACRHLKGTYLRPARTCSPAPITFHCLPSLDSSCSKCRRSRPEKV